MSNADKPAGEPGQPDEDIPAPQQPDETPPGPAQPDTVPDQPPQQPGASTASGSTAPGGAVDDRMEVAALREQTRRLRKEATGTMRLLLDEHPLATLAVAIGAGMLLSGLTRR